MTNAELLHNLRTNGFFLKDGRVNPQALKKLKGFPFLEQAIKQNVPFLPEDASFSQIVFALKNNQTKIPACPVCNTNIKFDKPSSSYPITCSPKCGAVYSPNKTFKTRDVTKEPEVMSKRISNRKRRYRSGKRSVLNDANWLHNKHCKELFSIVEIARELEVTPQTVKRALIEHAITTPPQQKLRESSNLRKYGVNNPGLLAHVREKARESDYANRLGGWKSRGETEMYNFILQLLPNTEIHENTQRIISPYELDIFVPEYNLAIEYCGLYWHSDKFKKRYYHRDKQQLCNEKGIRLLTIFEDEWRDKQQIVEAKIKSILGLDDRPVVYARKTEITTVSTKTKNAFLNQHHIQGAGPGSITYGLLYDSELVALMTFIQRKEGKYELNRYATSRRVVGGFSKLLKHFQQNHDWNQIVSFADLRWSTGNLYETTGWTLDRTLSPDYYWCKNGQRWHKFNFRHKFLSERLEVYDPSLSENENCKNNGYVRIYNCGLNRYTIV